MRVQDTICKTFPPQKMTALRQYLIATPGARAGGGVRKYRFL